VHPGRILETIDGGKDWQIRYSGSVSSSNVGEVEGIGFVSATEGWALRRGMGLITTRTGGRSWTALKAPAQGAITNFVFFKTRAGWALTKRGVVLRTVNGGQSWVVVDTPRLGMTMCASSPTSIWLSDQNGDVYVISAEGKGHEALAASKVLPPAPLTSVLPSPLLTCTTSTVWAVYLATGNLDTQRFTAMRTSDNGQHWTTVLSGGGTSIKSANTLRAIGTLGGIGTNGGAHEWFLGYCGPCSTGSVVVAATENGIAFVKAMLPTSRGSYLAPAGITFFGERDGWVDVKRYPASLPGFQSHEKTQIYATRNGGASWAVIDANVRM
jgi:photosystem II stability/assembly factor-like uncharacterized protein